MNLRSLLKPATLAVVGAGDKPGTFGGDTCRNIMDYGIPDRVFFVNPKRESVFGRKCYPCLDALPCDIEQVVLCTPLATVEGLLKEASAKGAKSAVVFASGFKEIGTDQGRAAEESLRILGASLGILVMGPNCGGYTNFIDSISTFSFLSDKRDRKGAVGLISQSGQVCLSALDMPAMRLSYVISAGNCGMVGMEDYLEFLVDDPDTKVVAMFLEGVSQPGKLARALEKAARIRKPVVIQKIGRSAKGEATATSHTGSLSGADTAFDTVFKKFGVIRADDFQDLMSTSLTLATWNTLPEIPTIAAMNISGGETGMCADVGEMFGVTYPDFAPETVERLKAVLPFYATPRNPLDTTITVAYLAETYEKTVRAVLDDPGVGMLVIGFTMPFAINDPCIHTMYEGLEKVFAAGMKKPVVMLPFGENTRNPEYTEKLHRLGIPILGPPMYGFRTLRHIMEYIAYRPEERNLSLALPRQMAGNTDKNDVAGRVYSEFESMRLLASAGVPVPNGGIAVSAEDAWGIARGIGVGDGRRVVMKIASADIPHKTDAGGVKLGLDSEDAVIAAFAQILANCKRAVPEARIEGVFVQEMLEPGLEVILGVTSDPQFGPQIMCGLGGIFVEVFKDVAFCAAPLTKEEALGMIRSLKAHPLFDGYRGRPKLDVEALAGLIVTLGDFAVKHSGNLVELDCNPVFVYERGKGVRAADALLVSHTDLAPQPSPRKNAPEQLSVPA